MALLVTYDNKPIFVTAEQGTLFWLVKTGERKGTKETREKASRIDRIYLNRANAPDSYLAAYPSKEDRKPESRQTRLPYKE